MNYDFIDNLKVFTEKDDFCNQVLKFGIKQYIDRENGKVYSLNEHIEAVVLSLLSNQQKWRVVLPKLEKIKNDFSNYNADIIKNTKPEDLINNIIRIKAGNRNIKKQMEGLLDIIFVLENIFKKHGSIDTYYNSLIKEDGNPDALIKKLSKPGSEYKLKNMGIALVCEYLKNIGIDIGKPDTHIRRIFGKSILGFSKNIEATEEDVLSYMKDIADKKGISQKEVDGLLWLYCADGFGEICTRKEPKCSKCVIKEYCNKSKSGFI